MGNSSIFDIEPIEQNKSQLIRYSKKDEFTEKIVSEYFKKKINLNLSFDISFADNIVIYALKGKITTDIDFEELEKVVFENLALPRNKTLKKHTNYTFPLAARDDQCAKN